MNTHGPVKGLNLGGWLVIEKWMTPSLFAGTNAKNEHELAQTDEGKERLTKHYESFITATDLDWMKQNGIKILRVPIGYWLFGEYPPYGFAVKYLDWLMKEADKRHMQVLIDFHAAPGGQNDSEHGGYHGSTRQKPWLKDVDSQNEAIHILVRIVKRYGKKRSLWGVQLLNEPAPGLSGLRLARFYRKAFLATREYLRDGAYSIFSDGYAPFRLTNALGLMGSKRHPVAMDCHFYHCFSPKDERRTIDGHMKKSIRNERLIRFFGLFQPVIVGEWSAMLNGTQPKEHTKRFINRQKRSYERTLAIFYWSYKTENPGRWNYRQMCENGYDI